MPQFGASLVDDSRVITYDCNMFIVQATDLIKYFKWIPIVDKKNRQSIVKKENWVN
jgi:hypothetical protein